MKDSNEAEMQFPEQLALPSWVVPGTVGENARFLNGKVREIALCCFEIRSCLAYSEVDLPQDLARLNLRWHVHLPLDLDWGKGPAEVARQCLALREKLLFLHPHAFVLHPPAHCGDPRPLLENFSKIWHSTQGERIFLENTDSFDAKLISPDFLEDISLSFCLDPAHALSNRQDDLLCSNLPECAGLAHWNAPGSKNRHGSLIYLSRNQLDLFRELAGRLPQNSLHVLEIFDWHEILQSLPILKKIMS